MNTKHSNKNYGRWLLQLLRSRLPQLQEAENRVKTAVERVFEEHTTQSKLTRTSAHLAREIPIDAISITRLMLNRQVLRVSPERI